MAASANSLKRTNSIRRLTSEEGDELIITILGAGNEVGRSCVHMTYKGKTVLFDCGIHPGFSGMSALPYFDEIDLEAVDVLLITHFHLDHTASLPYFLEKTKFKGRVFMTHATKAIYKLLLSDYVKVSKVSVEDMLFDEEHINKSMEKIEVMDFHQTLEVNGIRFWCYTAGHVLGAAMFMVDIAGARVLYTGDYSREEDRHLRAAEKELLEYIQEEHPEWEIKDGLVYFERAKESAPWPKLLMQKMRGTIWMQTLSTHIVVEALLVAIS